MNNMLNPNLFSKYIVKGRYVMALLTLNIILFGGANSAFAYSESLPHASKALMAQVPLLFNVLTTFKELFLQPETPEAFGPLVEGEVVEKPTLEELKPPIRWTLPDQAIRQTEAMGDPIPSYFPFQRLWHTVQRGEDRNRLDDMYRYRLGVLESLNPGVPLDRIQEGDRILVWQRLPFTSQSRGRANRGTLLYGEPLRQTDATIILYQHRVFGTTRTVAIVQSVLDAYAHRFPDTHPLIIGDISYRAGGHIKPHRSHKTGRDIDISYPNLQPPKHYRRFTTTRNKNLDTEKTLWLLKHFIDSGYVEYIFVDRRLQRLLVKEAERQGAPPEWIASVFQYRGRPNSIIRHERGHRNHFHIRFRCTVDDLNCHDSIKERRRAEKRSLLLAKM